jgi:hypothetical protein
VIHALFDGLEIIRGTAQSDEASVPRLLSREIVLLRHIMAASIYQFLTAARIWYRAVFAVLAIVRPSSYPSRVPRWFGAIGLLSAEEVGEH